MINKINRIKNFLEKKKGALIVIVGIIFFNMVLYNFSNHKPLPRIQHRGDASGFSFGSAKQFAYFHYYTGDFPLASLNKNLKFSKEDAHKEISENGQSLIMEYKHWSRLGENARIWAFLPDSIINGSPKNPSIKLFNVLIFTLSIIILYLGFWRLKKVLFGVLLVLLINLTPFYLYETYTNQNIFGLLGATFFIILGLNVFSLFKKEKTFNNILLIAISGSIIGFFSEFRNEISIVILSLILISLFSKQKNFLIKVVLASIGFGSFFLTKSTINYYFQKKFKNTIKVVEEAGGHPYKWATISGHRTWHPIFCGLGDFDTKYGFEWNDKVAYRYAMPILKDKYGMNIEYSGKYHLDNYYDESKLYYIKFDEIDEYEQIVKDKVLYLVKSDPIWYIKIISKRIIRTLSITIPVPYFGWGLFFLMYYFVRKKNWPELYLLIVSLPLSATSIIIYSGRGATYNSVFVYFVISSIFMVLYKEKKQLIE